MSKLLNQLEDKIKIKFNDKGLLYKALTHKSFNSLENYEKLEFLGDRVLGLAIAEYIIEYFPKEKVGILDKKLASVVNKTTCLNIAKHLDLNKFILIGNTNKKKDEIQNKILSDCVEAIIGAIYLDKGFNEAKKFILNNWKNFFSFELSKIIDSKTKLQEYSLKHFKTLPVYKLVSNTGPRHKPLFKIGVKIKDSDFVYANGSSKKNAEQLAAKKLLEKIEK